MICIAWVRVAGFASCGFEWLVLGLLLAAPEVASCIVAVCWPSLLEATAAVVLRGCWVRKSLLRCCWSCSWLLDPTMIDRGCYCQASFDRLGDGCLRDVWQLVFPWNVEWWPLAWSVGELEVRQSATVLVVAYEYDRKLCWQLVFPWNVEWWPLAWSVGELEVRLSAIVLVVAYEYDRKLGSGFAWTGLVRSGPDPVQAGFIATAI
ncbi:hypothetical protein WN944_009860 [Citrus x changshan-huyou]|uniref:Uncharacterized protein n=1 Tax=Citrus x changshan-huyou TaxID=2935761 RepID=A0AAP0MTU7_9ROSI